MGTRGGVWVMSVYLGLLCWMESINPTLSFTSGPQIFRAPNADRILRSELL